MHSLNALVFVISFLGIWFNSCLYPTLQSEYLHEVALQSLLFFVWLTENESLFASDTETIDMAAIHTAAVSHADTIYTAVNDTTTVDTAAIHPAAVSHADTIDTAVNHTTTVDTAAIHTAAVSHADTIDTAVNDTIDTTTVLKRVRTDDEKFSRDVHKHPMLPMCSCNKSCISKVAEKRRMAIHTEFWKLDYNGRKVWIASHVKKSRVKRPRPQLDSSRNFSRYYMLPGEIEDVFVCKKFFLHTLGFTADKVITTAVRSSDVDNAQQITVPTDLRGKHEPSNKLSDQEKSLIALHIESYHPAVSHYRREHAPLRRYLPPEITIRDMHQDFIAKYPGHKCSYEIYRTVVSSMKISFVKLGEEECELCMMRETHKNNNCTETACQSCSLWSDHMQAAQISRRHYQDDSERTVEDNEAVLSVDMQKVIMLPRMPGVKTCVFTRRLVCFHETFAPLGGTKRSLGQPLGILWHEGLSSRNAEDVMSCYAKAMRHPLYRDKSKFTFYADNCSAQNKNWTLFTGMIAEVNRVGGPDQVTVKYLEKGHTFMAADSFHAKIERAMRKMRNLYDFNDFKTAVGKHGTAVTMQVEDFLFWENGMSTAKFTRKPVLADVSAVQFCKGSTKIQWKNNLDSKDWQEGDFLKKKIASALLRGVSFEPRRAPRGVSMDKKRDIGSKLCPLMPEGRKNFWDGLAVSETAKDLIDSY